MRWNRQPRVIQLLSAASLRGVSVAIVISETGHREDELRDAGFNVVHRPACRMQCAVIDRHIGWYGNVNLLGRPLPDNTTIRMTSSDLTSALLAAIDL